jgi:phosphoglycerate dehydrogenase-like enzyme
MSSAVAAIISSLCGRRPSTIKEPTILPPKEKAVATKIVFSPPLPKAIMDVALTMLPEGYELHVVDRAAPDFSRLMADAEYWMGFARAGMDASLFRAAPKLRLVQLVSAGYDRIDIEAARRAGVPVANNGGSNSVAVAEHTLLLILGVLKRAVWCHGNVVAGRWRVGGFDEHRLYELAGKTVGIVGLGTIGKKVARRVRAFDAQVVYYDIVRLTEDQEDALGVRFTLFEELLRTADILTLHVPLTERTRTMMGPREFGLMKPSAIIINTCRGPVVDEAALQRALSSGQIAGAGLDVMVEEPPPARHALFGLDNVMITPHMAGPTWENWPRAFRNAYDNIQRVAAGREPLWVIPELRA